MLCAKVNIAVSKITVVCLRLLDDLAVTKLPVDDRCEFWVQLEHARAFYPKHEHREHLTSKLPVAFSRLKFVTYKVD